EPGSDTRYRTVSQRKFAASPRGQHASDRQDDERVL
ncbi:MAG: hypothetical protein RLZZ518_117, partial [Actinomycetota bacterium]